MTGPTVEFPVRFGRAGRGGRTTLTAGPAPPPAPAGRVPRVARLAALAVELDGLVRAGAVADYAAVARLAGVTRARVTQVMNLLHLAPDILEGILFLPPVARGRDPVKLADLQPIAAVADWRAQRRAWCELSAARGIRPSPAEN